MFNETYGISKVNKVKILGVTFQKGSTTSLIEENWRGILNSIDRLLVTWSKRDLSIQGKIIVVKTFIISKCIYVMQSIGLPETVIHKINSKIFSFIWRKQYSNKKAFEKIKRTTMCSTPENGGLNMIDVKQMQDSFYIDWAIKLTKENSAHTQLSKLFFLRVDGVKCFEANMPGKTIIQTLC